MITTRTLSHHYYTASNRATHTFEFTLTDANGKLVECACDSLQARDAWLTHLRSAAKEEFYTQSQLLTFASTKAGLYE